MSSNLYCEYYEAGPGRWFYLIENPATDPDTENWDGEDDWRVTALAYGPFPTQDDADRYCDNNTLDHPSPGTIRIHRHDDPGFTPDEVLTAALERART